MFLKDHFAPWHEGFTKTLRVVKLITVFIIVSALHVSAGGFSQKITLKEKNASLEKIFREIKRQTGYNFIYNDELLKAGKKVAIEVVDVPLAEVLNRCFRDQPFTYSIADQTIVVKRQVFGEDKEQALRPALINITGRVTDEAGAPIASVSVVIPGTPLGSMTDSAGFYTIPNAPEAAKLLVSYVGYESQLIPVNGRSIINVRLKLEPYGLDETIVIGYGTTTRRLNTGSVSSITAKDIRKQTIDNPLTALQGRMPGVVITQDNGLPGGGVRVQIRGLNSASAGTIPLYVIDGVPFTLFNGGLPVTDALNAYGLGGANGNVSPFSMISPEDIDRIDVLKDADATAIYGSRGANGVILITTKKGGKGGTTFNFNVNTGTGKVNNYIPMMNTAQYLALRKEAFANSGAQPTTDDAKDLLEWDQNAYTDWQKWAIGGTAHTTNANASVSSGNAQNSFLFSTNYRHQGTVFPGDFRNTSFSNRLNAGHKSLNNRFNIDMAINYTYTNNKLPTLDLSTLYNLAPNYPLYNSDSTLNFTLANPEANLRKKYDAQTTNFISSVNIGYKILPSLTLKANLGYTLTSLHQTNTNPASAQNIAKTATPAVRAAANRLEYADNDNGNYIIEPQIDYNRSFGAGKLQLLVGATFQQNKSTGINLSGRGFTSESLLGSISSASTVTVNYNNYSIYKYSAFFGRANYNLQDKYILDATFRRDGSSRFGPERRFGNFGAGGIAWVFNKENFMKDLGFISFGKLRASYGVTGNDQISNYLYDPLFTNSWSGYSYMGTSTFVQYSPSNPDLHWESTKKLDIGLELGLFKDRINLKADFYRNRSSNQLVDISLPTQSGYMSFTGNLPAVIQNRGWEFELTTNNITGNTFTWTTALNLTFNQNKLVAFPDLAESSYSTSYIIGQPLNVTQLFHYTGVDPSTGAPTFQDINNDKEMRYEDDRIPMKTGTPYFGGLSNSFTFKNFTLDLMFQFHHRFGYLNNTLNDYHTGYSPFGADYYNQSVAASDRWTKSVPNAYFPAAGTGFNNDYFTLAQSDYNWGNTSFIKFKTISLAYNLPVKLLRTIGFKRASVYAQGQNLFTWAKQKYTYDPETTQPGTGSGLGNGTYIAFPQLRTIVAGINFSF